MPRGGGRIKARFERNRYRKRLPWAVASDQRGAGVWVPPEDDFGDPLTAYVPPPPRPPRPVFRDDTANREDSALEGGRSETPEVRSKPDKGKGKAPVRREMSRVPGGSSSGSSFAEVGDGGNLVRGAVPLDQAYGTRTGDAAVQTEPYVQWDQYERGYDHAERGYAAHRRDRPSAGTQTARVQRADAAMQTAAIQRAEMAAQTVAAELTANGTQTEAAQVAEAAAQTLVNELVSTGTQTGTVVFTDEEVAALAEATFEKVYINEVGTQTDEPSTGDKRQRQDGPETEDERPMIPASLKGKAKVFYPPEEPESGGQSGSGGGEPAVPVQQAYAPRPVPLAQQRQEAVGERRAARARGAANRVRDAREAPAQRDPYWLRMTRERRRHYLSRAARVPLPDSDEEEMPQADPLVQGAAGFVFDQVQAINNRAPAGNTRSRNLGVRGGGTHGVDWNISNRNTGAGQLLSRSRRMNQKQASPFKAAPRNP